MTLQIFVIDGNIGAGKTSLLNELESRGYFVLREPIKLQDLVEFSSNPYKYTYKFQLSIIKGMIDRLNNIGPHANKVILERDFDSSIAFSNIYFKKDYLNQEEYDDIMLRLIDWVVYSNRCQKPKFFIDVPVEECLKRIKKRDTIENMSKVDIKYTLETYPEEFKHKHYLRLDGMQTISEVADDFETLINGIFIDGNFGSGKTEFIENLKDYASHSDLDETDSFITLNYKEDPQKNGFVYESFVRFLRRNIPKDRYRYIIERSDDDIDVLTKLRHAMGYITENEKDMFLSIFPKTKGIIIHMDTPIETCKKRRTQTLSILFDVYHQIKLNTPANKKFYKEIRGDIPFEEQYEEFTDFLKSLCFN